MASVQFSRPPSVRKREFWGVIVRAGPQQMLAGVARWYMVPEQRAASADAGVCGGPSGEAIYRLGTFQARR